MGDIVQTSGIVASAVYIKVPNRNVISGLSGPAVVTESMFGSIFTTYQPISKFLASSAMVSSQLIRYPGGAMAEDSAAKYSLRFADVYAEPNPGDADYNAYTQKGLTDVLAAAVATHSDFSMVIPTKRYINDVATGVEDLKFFLRGLLHGDFGELPDHVILELGNETSWLGWVNGAFTPGEGSYGYIANAFLEAIRTVLDSSVDNPKGIDIDVALQIGTTAARGQSVIFDQITPENLRTVDAFVRHSALLDNVTDSVDLVLHGYDFQYEQQKLADVMDYWERAWNGNPPEMVLFDSAWSVGGGEGSDDVDEDYDHLGVGQGPAVVSLFSALIAGGSDMAAAWGATAAASSLFGVKGTQLSYGGQAFRLMSESLVGTSLVSGNVINGQWVNTNAYMDVVTYQDDSKVVTFVCGSDFPIGGAAITIDLSALGHFSYAWAEAIQSPDGEPDDHDVADMFDAEVEKYLVPVLHGPDGDSIHITMTHDHELVRIILAKEVPGDGSLYLYGSEASDSLFGALGDDSLYGNGGNDRIDARSGADRIYGGDGNDTIFSGDGNDSVLGGVGNDYILGGRGADVIVGEAGADQISAGDGSDLIFGGDGNDTLIGGTSDFDGADTILGGTGCDWLDGGVGMDELRGEVDNDTVYGQAGNDRLFLGDGGDLGFGGLGDDTINAGRDADRVYGGVGDDQINAGDGSDLVFGEEGNDIIVGGTESTDLRDSIYGGDGADTIDGGYGHDQLFGDADNDSIMGNVGNDMVYGGPGADVLSGGLGTDSLYGGDGNNSISGDDGQDRIDGGAGFDLLNGNAGSDTLMGNLNDDVEYGGSENDVLSGGPGDDLLSGDDGDDFLYGGPGNDTLTGGTGGDHFFHSGNAVDGTDMITDYNAAEGDLLMFSDATARPEDFLAEFRAVSDSGDGVTYEMLITYEPGETVLWSLIGFDSSEQLNLQIGSQIYDILDGGAN